MRAGALRHLLTVEQASETQGTAVVSWTEVGSLHGQMTALGGTETSGLAASNDYSFRTRYRAGLDVSMRLRLGDRVFQITQPPVDPDGRRKELRIIATEIL